ncbi:hypothetical protein OF117_15060 [Geodermatophilus sp. YIM 151500]|uniref:hypothetical protein n=1 Tax=Geodermatophilus sp. YIM 151500 TaxID=2984531 RepID=UPI0021E3EFBF|nr:hypothetical protein [Geodermatophilus sp. YIM 151500]MCV2490679.1 hypothetical protein [Geodermatophilus sp. YIM 151500]
MRTSLSTVVRHGGVLAAVALVCLTTACRPAQLGVDATGTPGRPDVAGESQEEEQPPIGVVGADADAVVVPEDEVPLVPAPPPVADEPPTADATRVAEQPADDPGGSVTSPAPTEVATDPPQGAAGAHPGRRHEKSASRRPAPDSARGPAATQTPEAPGVSDAAASSSGGASGVFSDQPRQSFAARSGHTGRYLLYAGGIDPAQPVGLVVYVDGTGEHGVDNPDSSYALGGSTGLVATARARNMMTLAVESPNQSCECWHTGDTSGYADFLAELIEAQLAAYPVAEVWLSGFSSGAQEVTRFLVPRHPELLRHGGGWVLFGGGGPPADGGAAVTTATMAGVRGHWYTGTADTAVPLTASWGAQAGERFYAARGVITSHEFPAGVGHALDGRLGRTVGQLIDAS